MKKNYLTTLTTFLFKKSKLILLFLCFSIVEKTMSQTPVIEMEHQQTISVDVPLSDTQFPNYLVGKYKASSNQSDYFDEIKIEGDYIKLYKNGALLNENYRLNKSDGSSYFLEMLNFHSLIYDKNVVKDRFFFKVTITSNDANYHNLILKVIHPNSFEELLTLTKI